VAKANPPTAEDLKKAVKGLAWVSESEAPLEAFAWPAGPLTDAEVRKQAGAKGAVETMSLDDFFHAVPAEDRAKFDPLVKALKQLEGVKVYKVGDEAEKQVFIVGKAADGTRAGVKTTAVET
jgi:histidine triad (HIT) family protein